MRKLLVLSVLMLLVASAAGCVGNCGNLCGGWRPGQMLFGGGQQQMQPTAGYAAYGGYAGYNDCCNPCAGGATMIGAPTVVNSAPCCQ